LPTTKFYGERLSVRLDGEVVTAPARLHNDSTHFVPIDPTDQFNKNWSMVGFDQALQRIGLRKTLGRIIAYTS
jgi:hypothetical protein